MSLKMFSMIFLVAVTQWKSFNFVEYQYSMKEEE